MIRGRIAFVCVVALLVGAMGHAAAKPYRIAVIPKGTTHEFWKSIHAGAAKAAKEFDVEIIWQGPQKEDDRELQIQVVQSFVSRRVDAIVLAPLDEVALVRPVREAVRRGIKVVVIDSGLKAKGFSSFVATDNYQGGRMGAKRLGEVMGGQGKALLLRYSEGSASTMKREQGFLDEMAENYPGIELVSTNRYAGATRESAFKEAQNLLTKFSSLDGVFCPNESSAAGMLRALQTAGKAGKVKYVGFDSSETLLNGLKAGEMDGLVVQNPFLMGYLGVKTAVEVLQGKKVKRRIDTGVVLVTRENMATPEMVELLTPDLDKWLKQ